MLISPQEYFMFKGRAIHMFSQKLYFKICNNNFNKTFKFPCVWVEIIHKGFFVLCIDMHNVNYCCVPKHPVA